MSENLPEKGFNPATMADLLKRKREAATSLNSETEVGVVGPIEGKEVEVNGEKLRWNKVPTGKEVWNSDIKRFEPGYHSLRTWFSHHTDGVGAGPGWDGRFGLVHLTPAQQMERYGHKFTNEEISAPSGTRNFETGQWEGGMPNDIPYLELEPVDDSGLENSLHN